MPTEETKSVNFNTISSELNGIKDSSKEILTKNYVHSGSIINFSNNYHSNILNDFGNGYIGPTLNESNNKVRINPFNQSTNYQYIGVFNISNIHLSGKKCIFNRSLRFVWLLKNPNDIINNIPDTSFIYVDPDVVYPISLIDYNAVSVTNSQFIFTFPEFDEETYGYIGLVIFNHDIDNDSGCSNLQCFGGNTVLSLMYYDDYLINPEIFPSKYTVEKVININNNFLSKINESLPDYLLKSDIIENISSSNLCKFIIKNAYPSNKWDMNTPYSCTNFIQVPESGKLLCNVKVRGISAYYSTTTGPEFEIEPVANANFVDSGYINKYNSIQYNPGNIIDIAELSPYAKKVILWLYNSGTTGLSNVTNPYVCAYEDYNESLFGEKYFDSYEIINKNLLNNIPISYFKNDIGYINQSSSNIIKIDAKNSDKIIAIGDSYTEAGHSLPGKTYLAKLSLFSDYCFENFALSGDTYYGNINRARNNDLLYGTSPYASNANYAMMVCFTNDIKTLNANQYADALRSACKEMIGRGIEPLIFTEYHSGAFCTYIATINNQVAKEFNLSSYNISSNVQLIRGSDYAPFWGGSHPGPRTNAIESDNYEKYFNCLERPSKSMKLFRLRNFVSYNDINELIFYNNEERAEKFKEILIGQSAITDYSLVDQISTASSTRITSEYQKLINKQAIEFSNICLASFVIPAGFQDTTYLKLNITTDQQVYVYIKDISAGNYIKPVRYFRFDYGSDIVNMPEIGSVYTCDDIITGSTIVKMTLVDIIEGEGDGDALGYLLFSGAFGNTNYNDSAGILNKFSGNGDDVIRYSYRSIAYRAQDLSNPQLAGWTELEGDNGEYIIQSNYFNRVISIDKLDFLIIYNGQFNISDISLDWSGNATKVRQRKELEYKSNIARDTDELIDSPMFGEIGVLNNYWNIIPQSTYDSCYPQGCTSIYTVSDTNILSCTMDKNIGLNRRYHIGYLILEVWARYFPDLYVDGSGNQITEDSYDYATLFVDMWIHTQTYKITMNERVNTHWKIVQFKIDAGGNSYDNINFNFYSNKSLQIAKISLKSEY